MPKPDPAGRTFPVQRPSLPTPAPAKSLPEITLFSPSASKDGVTRPRRDYWTIAFAIPVIAAILLLGWRVGEIFWGGSTPLQKQNLSRVQSSSVIAKSALPQAALNGETLIDPHIAANAAQSESTAKRPHTSPIASREEAHSKIGPVVIRALVGRDGKVQVAQVIRGNKKLSVPALAMVRQLNFNPYAPHGTPLEFETEVTVSESGARGSSDGIQFSIPRESEAQQPAATPVAVEKPSK